MNKVTIGIVLPYLKSRGTEKQALRLASGFVDRGAKVVLFVVQGWGLDSMYRAFENAGAQVVNVGPALDEGSKSVSFGRLWSLARLVRKHGCSVLLSRAGMTNRITGYAGRIAFVPTVVVLSGASGKKQSSANILKKWFAAFRTFKALGFPSKIVSVSSEGAENFRHNNALISGKVVAIQNGIDCPEPGAHSMPDVLAPGRFNFCYSGSLEIHRKGLDVLIGALRILVREFSLAQANLVLIGTGEDEAVISELVDKEGLREHVMFAGEQSDPYPFIMQCQAFVLSSRKEGLPNALLEAMALGLCVISADCDTGPREIIAHEVNGLLVPVEDQYQLAEAMARVLKNDNLRTDLAAQAKITVQNKFSYEKMIDIYYKLLKEF